MNGNEARAYAEIGTANGGDGREAPTPDIWERETDEAHGIVRLRLRVRGGTAADGAGAAGRKRGKRPPVGAGQDRAPPPRPRIVWRREDEAETRPPPEIVME